MVKDEVVKKKKPELVLYWNENSQKLIPMKWKYPHFYKKKDYIAIIIGLNNRYEFERAFPSKKEFESDENESLMVVGYDKTGFKDGLIIEERFSYKKNKTFITETNYYEIEMLDDGIWGHSISKSEIKSVIALKQQEIYEKFKDIFAEFGEEFSIHTMQSIIKQKTQAKNYNFFFLK